MGFRSCGLGFVVQGSGFRVDLGGVVSVRERREGDVHPHLPELVGLREREFEHVNQYFLNCWLSNCFKLFLSSNKSLGCASCGGFAQHAFTSKVPL